MVRDLSQITLVLGVDAQHLEELRWVWPTWIAYRREILQMPLLVFYDAEEVDPAKVPFMREHPNQRWVAWEMPFAQTHREKMLSGWVHIPAREVRTTWYLKLDADAFAYKEANWLQQRWFTPNAEGQEPVFISSSWEYSKPRYIMNLLDDWGDRIPALAKNPRLNLPYSTAVEHVSHPRIISWFFVGRTDWTQLAVSWLGKDGRLPFPSQDTFLFYCAKRGGWHYVRERMARHGWNHARFYRLKKMVREMGLAPVEDLPGHEIGVRRRVRSKERGVVYYNTGTSCAIRLLVSLHSLRRHYDGPVTILSEGDASHEMMKAIARSCDAEFQEWNCGVPEGENRAYLAKTRYHDGTPYGTTIALDSDTLVVGAVDDLFHEAEEATFCVSQLANWQSSGGTIARRIRGWTPWLTDYIEGALHFGPAINCGVVSFRKDAAIFKDWLRLALPGRANFIPDESCCQVILHRYQHRILDGRWNRSCKHDNPTAPDTRIIHYHGRKHCRPGLPFHAQRWVDAWNEVRTANVAGVKRWGAAGDRMLRIHLRKPTPSMPGKT